jgi:hypothetical protein
MVTSLKNLKVEGINGLFDYLEYSTIKGLKLREDFTEY